eukprot:SAG31_NODE_1409_length_8471_cov_12.764931_2_plen_441_part_00
MPCKGAASASRGSARRVVAVEAVRAAPAGDTVRVVTFSFLCPLLEKYGTFIARCNALIEKVSSFSDGVDAVAVAAALDSASATADLVELLLEHESRSRQRLRTDLAMLKLVVLQERALAAGVSEEEVEAALEGDTRSALVALIVRAEGGGAEELDLETRTENPMAGLLLESRSEQDAAELGQGQQLKGMRLKDLRKKAKELDVDAELLDDAMDADDAKTAVIALIEEAESFNMGLNTKGQLMQELAALRLKDLRERVKRGGMPAAELEDAMDSDDPEDVLRSWLVAQHVSSTRAQATLQSELQGLKLKDLRKRAKARGVSPANLEEAMDADDPESAVVGLLLAIESEARDGPQNSRADTVGDVAHLGSAALVFEPLLGRQPATRSNASSKHVMLSYAWSHQAQVKRVYDVLTQLGVKCWMDITGGMHADIYDSMAAGEFT